MLLIQVLELQLQLQRLLCDSTASPAQTEAVHTAMQPGRPNEGMGGPWIIGRKTYPELNGRAVRDVAVQAHITPPPPAVLQRQEHVHVQTNVCETSDRGCSPVPAPPHIKEEDDGKTSLITLSKTFVADSAPQRTQSSGIRFLHEDVFGSRVSPSACA